MKKAEATRLKILQKAFELIYAKGYQATSIGDILDATRVTKGAFYYHFKTKDKMGFAIIDEILKPKLTKSFIEPLKDIANPLEAIYHLMDKLLMKDEFLQLQFGCPASNLVQEMTPWNEEFRKALDDITKHWTELITTLLEKGKVNGFVRKEIKAKQATIFILSGYWGIRNFGKLANSKEMYTVYLEQLRCYLESLR